MNRIAMSLAFVAALVPSISTAQSAQVKDIMAVCKTEMAASVEHGVAMNKRIGTTGSDATIRAGVQKSLLDTINEFMTMKRADVVDATKGMAGDTPDAKFFTCILKRRLVQIDGTQRATKGPK
jgi:hypothetical protein